MKLRIKIGLALLFVLAIFIALFSYVMMSQKKNIGLIVNERTQEFEKVLQGIVELKSVPLKTLCMDYSLREETGRFAKTSDKTWANENIPTALETYGVDYVLIYDENLEFLYESKLKEDGESLQMEFVKKQYFDPEHPTFSNFFIKNRGELLNIFIAPIQPSDDFLRESKPLGYLVGGKIWDKQLIEGISEIINQEVSLASEAAGDYDIYFPLKDREGNAVATLGLVMQKSIDTIIENLFQTQMVIILLTSILSAAVFFGALRQNIDKPLNSIMEALTRRNKKDIEYLLDNDDEMGKIANVIKDFFKQNYILEQYKKIIDESSIVTKTDKNGIITYVNDEFVRISGFSREEAIGKPHNIVKHPDNSKEFFAAIWRRISSGKSWIGVIKNRNKEGEDYYVRSVIAPILDESGNIEEYIAIRSDVTEVFEQMQFILKQTTDGVTGLPNRQQLNIDLDDGGKKALLLVNIDRFRGINDSYGHEFGDKVLIRFSAEIAELLPVGGALYRVSGDEFAILFKNYENEDVVFGAKKIIERFSDEPMKVGEIELAISIRVSIARGTEMLYQKADMAMHHSKNSRVSLVDYDENEQIKEDLERSREVTQMIYDAIRFDFVQAYGQKVVDADNHDDFKVETLMRIVDEEGKVIPPFIFLEQAKHSKLYTKLTRIMILKVFEAFKENHLVFSINLTFEDILDKETVEFLFENLVKFEMQNRVIIELVESEQIVMSNEINDFIKRAKEFGCKISIDDFGSGYSNFDYILRIGADFVKIDGSLMKDIDTSKNAYLTVKSIVALAKELGLKVVAEYIHNQEVQDIAIALGIDYLQGYYLHKPEILESLTSRIAA